MSAIVTAMGLAAVLTATGAESSGEDAQMRALKVLRDSMVQQERRGAAAATNPPAPKIPTLEELERLYLDGKLSARQFRQYVQDYKLVRSKPAPATQPTVAGANPAKPGMISTNAPPPGGGEGEEAGVEARLAELEARMDSLLTQRTVSAQAETNVLAGPKTKRQRMDELLRQLIAGKITQAEYDTQRARILAEPDPAKPK